MAVETWGMQQTQIQSKPINDLTCRKSRKKCNNSNSCLRKLDLTQPIKVAYHKALELLIYALYLKHFYINQNYNKILDLDWLSAARFEH